MQVSDHFWLTTNQLKISRHRHDQVSGGRKYAEQTLEAVHRFQARIVDSEMRQEFRGRADELEKIKCAIWPRQQKCCVAVPLWSQRTPVAFGQRDVESQLIAEIHDLFESVAPSRLKVGCRDFATHTGSWQLLRTADSSIRRFHRSREAKLRRGLVPRTWHSLH